MFHPRTENVEPRYATQSLTPEEKCNTVNNEAGETRSSGSS